MSVANGPQFLSEVVAELLPSLRRYARALTGSQQTGDRYAAATLEALLSDRSVFDQGMSHRVALFHAFHQIWTSLGEPISSGDETGIAARAQSHLKKLTANTREVLLLNTIEEFTPQEIALIMGVELSEVDHLLMIAKREMEDSVTGRILVIEDEAIIALDLQAIIADMGHAITGVARTHAGAVSLADQEKPDLILSDIQLADGSSGVEAVNEILKAAGDIPVIFITAFPERLLTGERPEPAFVITKPYTEEQVVSAVSQAMFFSSTETLVG
ncbi:putative transcriptional regulatory protein pdtaR [Aquimixticola soesokkakensis]|uniref:Putative transcriptional regulatory protein pdtaR n=1 Tax=Aquimixticola soesokkakensis TaxID=1519096 RepID=A0A1Y5RGK8_9RHOB|nr:response regulator [Aquimixticola soesokkakensis]SLN14391.1 putative transcriptional regulatory protein pdtaR [Aquimixticola soesokkakensis]